MVWMPAELSGAFLSWFVFASVVCTTLGLLILSLEARRRDWSVASVACVAALLLVVWLSQTALVRFDLDCGSIPWWLSWLEPAC